VLADHDVGPGDVVGASTGAPIDFLVTFHAALYLGAVAMPLAPPGLLGDGFAEHLAELLRTGCPKVVVVGQADRDHFVDAIRTAGVAAACMPSVGTGAGADAGGGAALPPAPARARRDPSDLALLQFTSGSSGRPRAVRIGWENLATNLAMLRRSWDYGPADAVASWLPLHHDMGLTACFLTALSVQSELWMLTPEQFLFEPLRWLECFGRFGATVTCSPNLGYGLCARRLGPERLEGMDFTAWKAAVIAAERVDPRVMDAFITLTGDFGFRPWMFRPAYGLAEATVAVTMHSLDQPARILTVDWSKLELGAPVTVTAATRVGEAPATAGFDALVSAGVPLTDTVVRIVDEEDRALPDDHLGEVVVGGPAVAQGYLVGAEPGAAGAETEAPGGGPSAEPAVDTDEGPSAFRHGEIHTGDAGLLHEGELFVVGRMADSLKVRGRQLYVEGLEALVAGILGLPPSRCVLVPASGRGGRSVSLLVESADDPELLRKAAAKLHWQLGGEIPVLTYAVERGTIVRTTSGKVRRRHMWATLLRGDLDRWLVPGGDPDPGLTGREGMGA
jgi:fatty-acyl-CoA synthase